MKVKQVIPVRDKLVDGFERVLPEERFVDIEMDRVGLQVRANGNRKLIKELEMLYDQRRIPDRIVFDYQDPRANVHDFVSEIYMKQNLHLFRNIPIFVVNFEDRGEPLIDPVKVFAINGSPRKKGDTKRLLEQEVDRYWSGMYYDTAFTDIPHLMECTGCGGHQKNCKPECIHDDGMDVLLEGVKNSDVILLGSPVYMDLPTSRTLAFLSRLTGETKRNRRAYIGKYASALSPAWCSGTKTVISSLNNALEMMGFTIQGRSSREYIQLWRDEKTRGGVPHDYYWPE